MSALMLPFLYTQNSQALTLGKQHIQGVVQCIVIPRIGMVVESHTYCCAWSSHGQLLGAHSSFVKGLSSDEYNAPEAAWLPSSDETIVVVATNRT